MDKKKNPCNEDPNYNFLKCIWKSLTNDVGCQLPYPWDFESLGETPYCSTMDEMNELQAIVFNISYDCDLESIIEKTLCIAPCTYKEYKLVIEPSNQKYWYKLLTVAFTDNKLLIEEEIESYSLVSLVSDIGGALGLFLGFSFVMVWDAAEKLLRKIVVNIGKYVDLHTSGR